MPRSPSERPPTCGMLKKYTNFVNGYQPRYFEIRNGKIAYYYSKTDKTYCRGIFPLKHAIVEAHPDSKYDIVLRFPDNVVWYLQAEDPDERDQWIKALTKDNGDSDYSSSSTTHSHSRNPSVSSALSFGLPLPPAVNKQLDGHIEDLAGYKTLIASRLGDLEKVLDSGESVGKIHSLDIRATRLAVTSTLDDVIELLKKNINSTSSLISPPASPEEPFNMSTDVSRKNRTQFMNTVTFVTSDGEEEFHDADEHSSLGSIELAQEARESSRASSAAPSELISSDYETAKTANRHLPFGCFDELHLTSNFTLYAEINDITMQQLRYAMEGVDNSTWTLFAEDGEMKMFKREVEMDGLPVDPLKALHHVSGVSALEYMHYFFDPRYKTEWDHTLENLNVLERPAPDTAVLHQKHKTIWPAASRESLFWSHLRRVDSLKSPDAADLYIVCNKDVVRNDVPLGSSSAVRVKLTVSMVCETILRNGKSPYDCTRDDVSCRILYVSCVHPGGWVPTAALRTVYKKEYPKFLRTFTEFVQKNVRNTPLSM